MNVWDVISMIVLAGIVVFAVSMCVYRKKHGGCCGECCKCNDCEGKKK